LPVQAAYFDGGLLSVQRLILALCFQESASNLEVIITGQRDSRQDRDRYCTSSTPRRRKSSHDVSESEDEYDSDRDDGSSKGHRFQDPNDFLRAFGGYETDEEDPDDDLDDEIDHRGDFDPT
jgi:hypothetical protein